MAIAAELTREQREVIERAAESAYFCERMPVPAEMLAEFARDFFGFVNVPRFKLQALEQLYGAEGDAAALLQADWEVALDCGAHFLFNDATVSFALHVELANGTAVMASIARNAYGGKPWYLCYVPDASRLRLKERATDAAAAVSAPVAAPAPATVPAPAPAPVSAPAPAPASAPAPVPAPAPSAAAASAPAPEPAAVPAPAPAATPAPAVAPSAPESVPAAVSEPPISAAVEAAMLAVADTPAYRDHPVAPELLGEFAGRTFSQLAESGHRFSRLLSGASGGVLDSPEARDAFLDRDFSFAVEHGLLRYYEDENGDGRKIFFPISLLSTDGEGPLEVGFWRNRNRGEGDGAQRPWFTFFLLHYKEQQDPKRGVGIFNWAYLGPLDLFLSKLASMALPERWSFDDADGAGADHAILRNYVIYTFQRLQVQEPRGVLENERMGIAAFNTGLVDEMYEPIYAVFVRNGREDAIQPWFFKAFCRAGSSANGGWGTRLSQAFAELPPRARYFERKEDLLYDTERPLDINYDHILLENITRLPADFLREEVPRSARAVLDKLDEAHAAQAAAATATSSEERSAKKRDAEQLFLELRELIEAEPKIRRRLMNRLEDAIELTLRRVEWNFRTAVPCYYPAHDSMSLLLPLDLTEDGKPDVALVVELAQSGRYLAKTILTMGMAYQDARLLCRPESDWLNTSLSLSDADELEL